MVDNRTTNIGGSVSESVVVTGDGNSVNLVFGDSAVLLKLLRKHVRLPDLRQPPQPGDPPRELDLLDPECVALPFIGRADMMVPLLAWADSGQGVSVLAVTGRAGRGKTRLALALCEALDPADGSGAWHAGFLSGSDLASVVAALATRVFDWTGAARVLVVLDNAAQCHQAVADWLDRLAFERFGAARLRILLLEREAPEKFGWWKDLAGDAIRRRLFHAPRLVALPKLADPEERWKLLGVAFEAAAPLRLGRAPNGIPPAGTRPDLDRALAGSRFGNPLNLVMAGVVAPYRGVGAALSLRRLDAAQYLAARELARFERVAKASHLSGIAMCHAVAFNALAGGLPVAGLPGTLAAELAAAGLEVGGAATLATLLEQELPPRRLAGASGGAERLGVIRPDLVAEAVTIAAFTAPGWREAEGPRALARAYALNPERSAAALMRLLQDFGYAVEDPDASDDERTVGRRVIGWLQALVEGIKDASALAPIAYAFPARSLVLREIAAEVQTRVADAFRSHAERSGAGTDATAAASALNNQANRLGDLGRWNAALVAAREAVELLRNQAAADPSALTPKLAMSLNTMAIRLSESGHRHEALGAAEEAVDRYRDLARKDPGVFAPDLANSLGNLATALGNVSRPDVALDRAQEAVGLYRDLVDAGSDVFLPDLARSLSNLAGRLGDLDRHKAGLVAAREAADLYRVLAAAEPDAFTPEFAASLANLANRLAGLNHREEALKVAREGVNLLRTLADKRPDVFRPNLATSLSNLGNRLGISGQLEEALKAAEEAVALGRDLAVTPSDTLTCDLAGSLGNLAIWLDALGRRQEALEAARESVELYRVLAAKHAEVFAPGLARSLWRFGNRQAQSGQVEPAIATLREGISLLKPHALARSTTGGNLVRGLVGSYLSRCREAGVEPDGALLESLQMPSFNTKGDAVSGQGNSRSNSVGGNVTGAILVAGDDNDTKLTQVQPPPAQDVDVAAEIAGLRSLLEKLAVPERDKLGRALDDARDEVAKPVPDKEDVASALKRAVTVSKEAADFADNADKIKERVVRIAEWVGPLAKGALALLGLTT